MQTVRLESGEAMIIRSGLQSGKFSQTLGASRKNQALVTSQSPRQTHQDRGEDRQAQ